jgi:SagB-type dehydrogenase family enzyme
MTDNPNQPVTLDGASPDTLWAIFHENSKLSHYDTVLAGQVEQGSATPAALRPQRPRQRVIPLAMVADTAQTAEDRPSERSGIDSGVTGADVSTVLGSLSDTVRIDAAMLPGVEPASLPCRSVPGSLAFFVHCVRVDGIATGQYYYEPCSHELHLLATGGYSERLASALFRHSTAGPSEFLVFIAAQLAAANRQHGERAYRVISMSAGCAIQKMADASSHRGLRCTVMPNYLDRDVDACLSIDGITQSVIVIAAIGG